MRAHLKYLETIDQLKQRSLEELTLLAEEIRSEILSVLSVNGGHLASNLGVVELTIALHYVFDLPEDRLIFDVSHQTYPHKLLTGRRKQFAAIRKFGGLCGFADPTESVHDHFYAGHAGTSLSLSLGVAHARDLVQKDYHTLPILGDASLTCGVTLEALNNLPSDLKKFIIVLNDNQMSIAPNVGNIKRILSEHTSSGSLQELVERKKRPKTTSPSSCSLFFSQFNLDYIGPIDGHDLPSLIAQLQSVKNREKPVLLHILTKKGQGLSLALKNPVSYHGAKPFDQKSGEFFPAKNQGVSFPKAFGKHLVRMAKKEAGIVAITPATPVGSCLTELMETFPERCFDVGIAEGHSVTFAGGLAKNPALKVFVVIYATFLQRAFDNLFHDVCLQLLPVVFMIDRAFISGPDGPTHHGIYDIGFLYAMPHLIIAQPRSKTVLEDLLDASLHWNKPAAIRFPNLPANNLPNDVKKERFIGKGEVLAEGSDLLIVALGHMCQTAFSVKELLEKEKKTCTIVDPIFIKPLDEKLFYSLFSTHSRVAVLEEHSTLTGLSSILRHFLLSKKITDIDMLSLGAPDIFIPHGEREKILSFLELTPKAIAEKILRHFTWNEIAIL